MNETEKHFTWIVELQHNEYFYKTVLVRDPDNLEIVINNWHAAGWEYLHAIGYTLIFKRRPLVLNHYQPKPEYKEMIDSELIDP